MPYWPDYSPDQGTGFRLILFHPEIQKDPVLPRSPLCSIGSIILSIIELFAVKPLLPDSENPLPP